MNESNAGGPMVVRLIDVLFSILFGYLMLANFATNAETEMPSTGGSNSPVTIKDPPLVLEVTVGDADAEAPFALSATKGGKGMSLAGAVGTTALEGTNATVGRMTFRDPRHLDLALLYRTEVVHDPTFEVTFQAEPSANVGAMFHLVDLCAKHGLKARTEEDSTAVPRVRFAFKDWGSK